MKLTCMARYINSMSGLKFICVIGGGIALGKIESESVRPYIE